MLQLSKKIVTREPQIFIIQRARLLTQSAQLLAILCMIRKRIPPSTLAKLVDSHCQLHSLVMGEIRLTTSKTLAFLPSSVSGFQSKEKRRDPCGRANQHTSATRSTWTCEYDIIAIKCSCRIGGMRVENERCHQRIRKTFSLTRQTHKEDTILDHIKNIL